MKASETIVGQWYILHGTNGFAVPARLPNHYAFVFKYEKLVVHELSDLSWGEVEHIPNCTGFDYQPPAPEPVYRPFATYGEFEPYRNEWFVNGRMKFKIWSYSSSTINDLTYEKAFHSWTFEDGTPFGMKVTKDAAQ